MIGRINALKDEARRSLFNAGVFEQESTTRRISWMWDQHTNISDITSWFARTSNSLLFPNRMDSEESKFNQKIAERDYTLRNSGKPFWFGREKFKDTRMRGAVLFSNTGMKNGLLRMQNKRKNN
jgi:hypothetical protein